MEVMLRCTPCLSLRFGSKLRLAVVILEVSSDTLSFSFQLLFCSGDLGFQGLVRALVAGKLRKNLGFLDGTEPESGI